MISSIYRAQVELLLRILPYIAKEDTLALKGGTAINLFVHDMPRFSVDIDLNYLPLDGRAQALINISESLNRIRNSLQATIPNIQVRLSPPGVGQETKLICQIKQALVKVEVNTLMRGHLYPVRWMELSKAAQEEFGVFARAQVVSQEELFGGKICAALDRQHPRDLFDVYQLLQADGLTSNIRRGFIALLLSHSRPMHELLWPNFLDQKKVFETQFAGMTNVAFSYGQFEKTVYVN